MNSYIKWDMGRDILTYIHFSFLGQPVLKYGLTKNLAKAMIWTAPFFLLLSNFLNISVFLSVPQFFAKCI